MMCRSQARRSAVGHRPLNDLLLFDRAPAWRPARLVLKQTDDADSGGIEVSAHDVQQPRLANAARAAEDDEAVQQQQRPQRRYFDLAAKKRRNGRGHISAP